MNECEYEQFLRAALLPILTQPKHLSIDIDRGLRSHRISVQVYGEDQAFVIGREARMVKAMQTILNHMAQRKGEGVQLGILDPQMGTRAAWRDFVRDERWDTEKEQHMISLLRPMLEAVFARPVSLIALSTQQRTEFLMNVPEPIEMRLLAALKTVVRSIGKAMGRDVEFQARLTET